MTLPDWISNDLIEDTLRNYLQIKTINVVGMTSKFAVPVGDNYCSDLFRVTVKYTTVKNGNVETISLIVKCKPEEGAKEILTTEMLVFDKETQMYNNTLKKLHHLLGKNCLAADCLKAVVNEHGWLIIQDLAPLGYKMADRQFGLDMDHTFLVIEKIALMHASSAVLYESDPHSMDYYNKGLYGNQLGNPIASHFCNSGYDSLTQAVSKWKGFEKYAKILASMQGKVFEKVVQASERRPGFNVLNHGDLWINNILFQYNSSGKLTDALFVDYQFSVFTSPAIDLQYFIYTSIQESIERKHTHRVLEYYYEELTKELKRLNYPKEKMPTIDSIKDDFFKRSLVGLTAAATVLPIVKAPPRKDANFETLMKADNDENGFRQISYNHSDYRNLMEVFLPHFEKISILEA